MCVAALNAGVQKYVRKFLITEIRMQCLKSIYKLCQSWHAVQGSENVTSSGSLGLVIN
jgi:hypothetical protein